MPPKKESQDVQALAKALSRLMKDGNKPGPSKGPAPKKKKPRAKRGSGTAEIRFSRTELVKDVTLVSKAASGSIAIHPDSAPILKKLASAFERIRWERVQFHWVSASSAMTPGNIVMGIDWDSKVPAKFSQADISAYAPSDIIPLREDTRSRPLRLSADKLRGRNWYEPYGSDGAADKQPGVLVYAASSDADTMVGHICMTYTVLLAGPHA